MTFAGWFMLFDVGISNGLRNKLSELIVKNKIKLSRAYLSSTYFYFAFFLSIIILLIVTIILLIDMSSLFNIKKGSIENLNLSVFLVFFTIFSRKLVKTSQISLPKENFPLLFKENIQ